ncbi:MAG: sulfoxide reductase heme-binding subunit YedZ [Betaproteobacteria bacterium]|nr:sulfoxide reductase heme-binding subunit YedZ [Betaproteobacteria bacterium]
MAWWFALSQGKRHVGLFKIALFAVCLIPLLRLVWGAWNDTLGANPIEFITRSLGSWALNFLLITLCVTPLRKLTGWNWLLQLRRMLGLYVFFYASLHLSTYLWLDKFFDWQEIVKDIFKRPFITIGMSAFAMLLPLALTSTKGMVRRLGGLHWQRLHRLIYVIAICAVVHYWWLVKLDVSLPAIYSVLLCILLGFRLLWPGQGRRNVISGNFKPAQE